MSLAALAAVFSAPGEPVELKQRASTIPVAAVQAPPSMWVLVSAPLLVSAVHSRVRCNGLSADGASTLTREWLEGKRKEWFAENQRGGAELVEAGIVRGDHHLVDAGLRMFEWGYARQAADGGFPESHDAFHSVSLFVVDSGRALLALREKREEFPEFVSRLEKLSGQLGAAAEWLLRPEVMVRGKKGNQPYTHRKWVLAAALGEAAQLAGKPALAQAAVEFANEGIGLQTAEGINPEKGGFDVSYQMVGVLEAARYYTTLDRGAPGGLMIRVRQMLEKACRWEQRRIQPDGKIDPAGSTRIFKEASRSGKIKQVNYREVVQAFSHVAVITGDKEFAETARVLAQGQGWLGAK